ncbi:MAG: response regulator [Pseudomonadota bacterium]|nr:response regulator [Pseudomonadota bacterium]
MPAETRRRDIVLVVDDTPETLSFLTDTLDALGATVLVATDGESALKLLGQITPDLILMDAVMPGMGGFEACRRIKREKSLAHLPVIFMTGLSDSEHVIEGLDAGGVDYVTKPIVVDELLARIRVHLANARAVQASSRALDATGRFLVSTDAEGQLLWCTPRAEQLLAQLFPYETDSAARLPADVAAWLRDLRAGGHSGDLLRENRRLQFTFVSSTEPGEFLFRVVELLSDGDAQEQAEARRLREALPLTQREAEALLWVSRGKANREISEILGISPRTVNKHLEQVFIKLGVEKRAAAAARATSVLSAWK